MTPTESSFQKLPIQNGVTQTASAIVQGYNLAIAEWSPYHGAAYAVIEAQTQLGLPSIGGKDSMSGTFEELIVPPTLVAFGVTTATVEKVLSPEFKAAGQNTYYMPGQAIS